MKSLKNLICYSDRKISFVLKKINENKKKFCVIINRKTHKVEGIVTDGDLRRSFLSGTSLEDVVSKAMNKKFIYSNSNSINIKLKNKLKKMIFELWCLSQSTYHFLIYSCYFFIIT